jgi:predicted nucleic acid-binding protein
MNDDAIVCNSGPLIALSMVGRLDLLRRLYQRVIVSDAVVREVIESGAGRVGAAELQSAVWIERMTLESSPEPLLAGELGSGEARKLFHWLTVRKPGWF